MVWAAFLEPLRLSRSEDLAEEVEMLEPIRISEMETTDVPGHTGYTVRRFLERPLSRGVLRLDHVVYEKGGGAEPHSTPHRGDDVHARGELCRSDSGWTGVPR